MRPSTRPRPSAHLPSWLPPTLLLGAWVACGGRTLTHIELDGSDTALVEQGTVVEALVGNLGFGGFTAMNVTTDQRLQNQGVEPGDISMVQLISFELEVLDPANGDLSFLQDFEVWVEAPGLEPVKIAEYDGFAAGQTLASFDVFDVDLTAYVVSESMTLRTSVDANRPEDDTLLQGRYLLDVGVTFQGAKNQACN